MSLSVLGYLALRCFVWLLLRSYSTGAAGSILAGHVFLPNNTVNHLLRCGHLPELMTPAPPLRSFSVTPGSTWNPTPDSLDTARSPSSTVAHGQQGKPISFLFGIWIVALDDFIAAIVYLPALGCDFRARAQPSRLLLPAFPPPILPSNGRSKNNTRASPSNNYESLFALFLHSHSVLRQTIAFQYAVDPVLLTFATFISITVSEITG
ncbi:hypothetical protein G7K_0591-t2 [Saitoella complicata NRRL Y-17804]|uniref:Cation/H+ exchanger domain-containing protein n=1 Tax=Saitoella complicata (strain BCRC 22490 / CBS 7301 / JCM 7358 / NBRC 10748 / NRRL Y-17804) TaxID=698492 RepID=A0A0E9NAF1_SAICN|nr:hypothetical protein G7K_0591-t2 [Saitoella complicata NRRL Y-17804]